jgi:hypothetical protein
MHGRAGVPDALQIRVRQLQESAVRQVLPAMARARLALGLKMCLAGTAGVRVSLHASLGEPDEAMTGARHEGPGTRVQREDTQVPGVAEVYSNELDKTVGQTQRRVTGR